MAKFTFDLDSETCWYIHHDPSLPANEIHVGKDTFDFYAGNPRLSGSKISIDKIADCMAVFSFLYGYQDVRFFSLAAEAKCKDGKFWTLETFAEGVVWIDEDYEDGQIDILELDEVDDKALDNAKVLCFLGEDSKTPVAVPLHALLYHWNKIDESQFYKGDSIGELAQDVSNDCEDVIPSDDEIKDCVDQLNAPNVIDKIARQSQLKDAYEKGEQIDGQDVYKEKVTTMRRIAGGDQEQVYKFNYRLGGI